MQTRVATVILVAAIVFFVASVTKLLPGFNIVRRENQNLNQRINEAESARLELERSADYLKSPAYLERQARIKLNYKKPGESVVFVYPRGTAEAQKDQEVNESLVRKIIARLQTWWQKIFSKRD